MFKNPGNLLRTFAVDAEVKDALDNRRGFLVQNPLVLVVRVAAVAVGRLAEMFAARAALMQASKNAIFLAIIKSYKSPLPRVGKSCGLGVRGCE